MKHLSVFISDMPKRAKDQFCAPRAFNMRNTSVKVSALYFVAYSLLPSCSPFWHVIDNVREIKKMVNVHIKALSNTVPARINEARETGGSEVGAFMSHRSVVVPLKSIKNSPSKMECGLQPQ